MEQEYKIEDNIRKAKYHADTRYIDVIALQLSVGYLISAIEHLYYKIKEEECTKEVNEIEDKKNFVEYIEQLIAETNKKLFPVRHFWLNELHAHLSAFLQEDKEDKIKFLQALIEEGAKQ